MFRQNTLSVAICSPNLASTPVGGGSSSGGVSAYVFSSAPADHVLPADTPPLYPASSPSSQFMYEQDMFIDYEESPSADRNTNGTVTFPCGSCNEAFLTASVNGGDTDIGDRKGNVFSPSVEQMTFDDISLEDLMSSFEDAATTSTETQYADKRNCAVGKVAVFGTSSSCVTAEDVTSVRNPDWSQSLMIDDYLCGVYDRDSKGAIVSDDDGMLELCGGPTLAQLNCQDLSLLDYCDSDDDGLLNSVISSSECAPNGVERTNSSRASCSETSGTKGSARDDSRILTSSSYPMQACDQMPGTFVCSDTSLIVSRGSLKDSQTMKTMNSPVATISPLLSHSRAVCRNNNAQTCIAAVASGVQGQEAIKIEQDISTSQEIKNKNSTITAQLQDFLLAHPECLMTIINNATIRQPASVAQSNSAQSNSILQKALVGDQPECCTAGTKRLVCTLSEKPSGVERSCSQTEAIELSDCGVQHSTTNKMTNDPMMSSSSRRMELKRESSSCVTDYTGENQPTLMLLGLPIKRVKLEHPLNTSTVPFNGESSYPSMDSSLIFKEENETWDDKNNVGQELLGMGAQSDIENSDDDNMSDDVDNVSDAGSDRSRSSFLADLMAPSQKAEKRYFWQYNMQSKGPKGVRLCKTVRSTDPHVLNDFEDPVFDPDQNQTKYKHNGKARRGDGNDITPNAYKLFVTGNELKKLNNLINEITPASELPSMIRLRLLKEKNKYASRACRLKKKAQHEANKLKLHGLEQEHRQLISVLDTIKRELIKRVRAGSLWSPDQPKMSARLDTLMKKHLTLMIAGHTSDYVNTVLQKVAEGDQTGGLIFDE